jgi:membrane protein YdbS with pleckstrin-like domain
MSEERNSSADPAQHAQPNAAAGSQPAGEGAAIPGVAGGDGASLDPNREVEIWTGRTHWKHYAGRLLLWLILNVVVAMLIVMGAKRLEWLTGWGAFWTITAIVVVSGLIVIGGVFFTIIGRRYRVTSQRLFIENGILSQTVDQTELIRVDDVRIHKTLLNRIFGLGTIAVLSTDASNREVTITGVADPDQVAESLRKNMRTMRQKSLFVENL